MDFIAYQNAMRGIYQIAHAVAENGQEQDRITRNIQQAELLYKGNSKEVVRTALHLLLKELEVTVSFPGTNFKSNIVISSRGHETGLGVTVVQVDGKTAYESGIPIHTVATQIRKVVQLLQLDNVEVLEEPRTAKGSLD